MWKQYEWFSEVLSCRESDLHVLCDSSKALTDKLRYVVELVLQEYFVPSITTRCECLV